MKIAYKKLLHQNRDVYPSFFLYPVVQEPISTKKLTGPKKFYGGIGWVQEYIIDVETRVMLIHSLALSTINYCFKIWGNTNKSEIQRVQKLQNFAAKIAVGNARKYDRATPYIEKMNWLKIHDKYLYELGVFMYKRVNGIIPEMLLNLTPVHSISQVSTRQSYDFYIPRSRTELGSRGLGKRGPKLWNELPREVKESCSLSIFKRKLMNFYLRK